MDNVKPKILVSACLGFEQVRYNGQTLPNKVVDLIKPFVEFVTVCPEVGIGLGVPRKPIRLVQDKDSIELFQPATNKKFTSEMNAFNEQFLSSLDVDGALLKYGSPTCGISNVKLYDDYEPTRKPLKTSGLFAAAIMKRFVNIPIEDEGRLTNFSIRENFLRQIFTLARFRHVNSIEDLKIFHTRHKLLFMGYHQVLTRELGRIIASYKNNFSEILPIYKEKFLELLHKKPSPFSWINVLQHAADTDKVSSEERKLFLDLIEEYRDERIPLTTLTTLVYSWAVRFNNTYLLEQFVFSPFPKELIDSTDSGKK